MSLTHFAMAEQLPPSPEQQGVGEWAIYAAWRAGDMIYSRLRVPAPRGHPIFARAFFHGIMGRPYEFPVPRGEGGATEAVVVADR